MEDEEDEYISFGNPLPELEDESTFRKKAAKELQVRDEKGRQRFHGAFTGGFSAGYFNTVGTKEGWAPSTFISSRAKIAERIQQNPEDFMDNEDFGEFGIATRKIHTTSNFQDVSDVNTRKRKIINPDAVIPGEAPLKDIVQPVRESIGYQILKRLGWRKGQGIGPRVKKQTPGTKMYGCSPFPDTVEPEEDDPMAMSYTFAPKDTESMFYQPKDDHFGIGYTGLSKQSVLSACSDPFAPTTTKSWLAKDKKKLTISGQAFGVGAFEDEDEDIYGKDDMSQYDFSDLISGGSKDLQRNLESKMQKGSQGVLEGFCLASHPLSVKKHYPAPALPVNFKPVHLKSINSVAQNVNLGKSCHHLSASARSLLLGEKKFQKSPSNVCDIQGENKNAFHQEPQALPSISATSTNFCLFPNDIAKQRRYEEYLKLKKVGDTEKFVQPSTMTEWEKQQEIEDFAKSYVRFKPLSNALSSRFESRSQLSMEHEVMATIEKMKKEREEKTSEVKRNLVGSSNRKMFEWHPVSLLCKRMNVPNPYPNSSSSGTRNMCKTKSVSDHLSCEKPHADDITTPIVGASSSNSENEICEIRKSGTDEIPLSMQKTSDISISENKEDLTSGGRPPIDFFKDIFENSSSDEENVKTEEKPKITTNEIVVEKEASVIENAGDLDKRYLVPSQNNNLEAMERFTQRNFEKNSNVQNVDKGNKKAGFGVFANLDLDALNQRKSTDNLLDKKNHDPKYDKTEASRADVSHNEYAEKQPKFSEAYGPDLPPNFPGDLSRTSDILTGELKKQMKSKSSHKHKHHKHKNKKKKKKKKSSKKDFDSSDSSDDYDDIPPEYILEKLKKLQK